MSRDLAIYGAGGFGRELALMVEQINADQKRWRVIGFFDDGKTAGGVVDDIELLGGIDALNAWSTPLSVVIALADPAVRAGVVMKIKNEHVDFPVMIHPLSSAGSFRNSYGKGTVITAGSILTTGIELKDFVIVNLASTIGHDVKIGSYTSVMPGCNISGGVAIGEGNLIGTGAQVLQCLSIGNHCKIGAGAVVTRSLESGKTFVGIPARPKGPKP